MTPSVRPGSSKPPNCFLPASTALWISLVGAVQVAREIPSLADMAAAEDEPGDDQFLHRVGVRARGVEYRNAERAHLRHRDVVHAGAGAAHGLERFRDLHVVHFGRAHQDGVRLLDVAADVVTFFRQARESERRDVIERQYLVHVINPFSS